MKNKKIILSTLATLVVILAGVVLFFTFNNSADKKIKQEHSDYVSEINDNHNFEEGLKGLTLLNNDKGKKLISNIDNEIKVAQELKNINSSLDNKNIDEAKKSLENVNKIKEASTFDKAISWLKEDIDNYDKVVAEFNNLDKSQNDLDSKIKDIIGNYKFKHSSLLQLLTVKGNEQLETANKESKKEQSQKTTVVTNSIAGAPDPSKLDDSNSLPADATGIGGTFSPEHARKFNFEIGDYYKPYLLQKYGGVNIVWRFNGSGFEIEKADGSKILFEAEYRMYERVGNRLASGMMIRGENGQSEFLFKTWK